MFGYWSNRHVIKYSNSYTGEDNLCICGKCMRLIEQSSSNRNGLNLWTCSRDANEVIRIACERNLLTKSHLDIIQKDEAKVRAEHTIGVATDWIAYDYDKYILLNDKTERIVINGSIYNFSDIKDYIVRDDSIVQNVTSPETTTYSTKTKSGLRRTITGKMFAGNVGAAMGAITADHSLSIERGESVSFTREQHDFSIFVNFKHMSQRPELLKIGSDADSAIVISSILDKIVNYHKQSHSVKNNKTAVLRTAPPNNSVTFCPQCGSRNLPSSRFCTSCGSVLRP